VGCHEVQHGQWMDSRHASAIGSLVEMGAEGNYECLECHTTGFRVSNGFYDFAEDSAFHNVQCEACHGPMALHAAAVGGQVAGQSSYEEHSSVSAGVCRRCHTAARDPEFDFVRDRALILHREVTR
jgi:hypothetical protein